MSHGELRSFATTIHVRIEEDVVFVRVTGSLTLRDFEHIAEINTQLRRQYGYALGLYDASRMDGIEPDARKALKTSPTLRDAGADVTAIFGASYTIQTLGNMIDRAMTALGRRTTGRRFFVNETLARAYLEEARLRLKKR